METVKVGITETIRVLLEEKKFNTLRDILVTLKPYDIATIFEELQDEKTPLLSEFCRKSLPPKHLWKWMTKLKSS